MNKYLDFIIYWTIILIPFSIAISPVPANIFMGFLIASFLVKRISTRKALFQKTPIFIPLLLFFAMTVISLIHSVSLKDSIRGGVLRLLQYSFVFLIITEELKDKRHIRLIIFSVIAGIGLVSLDSFWQVISGHDFIRGYPPVVNLGLVRATASFKDSNLLGIYLAALSPLIFGLTLFYFKARKRVLMAVICFIALGGIFLTYSRPTFLAIYLIFLFFGITRKSRLLVSILLTSALLFPLLTPSSIKKWAKEMEYNPLRLLCNDDRIAVYRNSLNMIRAHPFIGLGANTYMKNYKKYKEFPEYRNIVTLDYMYAHNHYLQMAAEIGLIGLGIFIWFLYRLFSQSWHIYCSLKDNYFKVIALSLIACLLAFLINGLTESSLHYARVAAIFWYLAGLVLSLRKFVYL